MRECESPSPRGSRASVALAVECTYREGSRDGQVAVDVEGVVHGEFELAEGRARGGAVCERGFVLVGIGRAVRVAVAVVVAGLLSSGSVWGDPHLGSSEEEGRDGGPHEVVAVGGVGADCEGHVYAGSEVVCAVGEGGGEAVERVCDGRGREPPDEVERRRECVVWGAGWGQCGARARSE